jgi:CRISPR-associated endonuclease/helicase Cas3
MSPPLAHSPRGKIPAQTYARHVAGVVERAVANATEAAKYRSSRGAKFVEAVRVAAEFHDLGKLSDENQEVLRRKSREPLPIPHEDAGVAHLLSLNLNLSAIWVDGHHNGLFELQREILKDSQEGVAPFRRPRAVQDTKANLPSYVELHNRIRPCTLDEVPPEAIDSGFGMRVGLSCLVDGDHSDTAENYGQEPDDVSGKARWQERLEALQRFEAAKQKDADGRSALRHRFFEACLEADPGPSIQACDAPVGSGKTLGVMAHLVRAAHEKGLRHIIVVLPYTNIVRQSVKEYREALTLPGEVPEHVVAEHHHQADFASVDTRHMATLWRAPVTVTTAVQFFETLASHHPSKLRKLHELPGSAVFLDETHACIPPHLWRVTWGWIEEWTQQWGGHLVLASGSLPEFWKSPSFVATPRGDIPNLVSEDLRRDLAAAERTRITPQRQPEALCLAELIEFVHSRGGPRLVILNTVQNAARVASAMRENGLDVLHLSTALAPVHRDPIIDRVRQRLKDEGDRDWTLVATSCVEAGVDFSFRSAVREAASTSSLIQVGGRVRRHMEDWEGELWSVRTMDEALNQHPGLVKSADVLDGLLKEGAFDRVGLSDLILEAWHRELTAGREKEAEALIKLQEGHNHRSLSESYQVIASETRLVVIDQALVEKLQQGIPVNSIELLRHSVQVWGNKLDRLPVKPLTVGSGRSQREIHIWTEEDGYDPLFLGYMASGLVTDEFLRAGGAVV